jgi:hypothetical protein
MATTDDERRPARLVSVSFVPAGGSVDAALGEEMWEDREAIDRFIDLWAEEASALLGGVPVTMARDLAHACGPRLEIETDLPGLVDPFRDDTLARDREEERLREAAGEAVDRAYEAAAARILRPGQGGG